MATSFLATDNIFEISWSVAFKWYIIHNQGVCIYWFRKKKKLPFALGGKGLGTGLRQASLLVYFWLHYYLFIWYIFLGSFDV